MQETFCYFIGILVALGATLMIAFPERMVPEIKRRKQRFTGKHWGAYQDSKEIAVEDADQGIEVQTPAKKAHAVVGSSTYAGGRGVGSR